MFCQMLNAISEVMPKALKHLISSAFNGVGTLQLKRPTKTKVGCQVACSAMVILAASEYLQTEVMSLKTASNP